MKKNLNCCVTLTEDGVDIPSSDGAEVESPQDALLAVKLILTMAGEKNWICGIDAVLDELRGKNDHDNAKSIIKTMMRGGGGFSEYYISSELGGMQKEMNRKLDSLKDYLWAWAIDSNGSGN
ncbi:MAG: hypothetical protein JO171_06445 [Paludibacterium sp.]|uniref:hypothetical protein n=1 Tax=Paludibacterium sp. TaxID=1917523 RepID=UPI0025D83EB4|nr:hypothetical protein [Paludibacterium sp.]MBV8046771.1 hypothetical protein [Paludibacterium sp.]